MMIKETLKSLGLTDKEIAIYLALLPIGSSPASILGQRTKITRSTAQYTCQQLQKKGLIKAIQKGNTLIYSPEPPEKLLYLLEQQKKEINEKEDQVERIIGDLKGMINPQAVLPKVKFYEGIDGIKDAYSEMIQFIKPGDDIISFVKIIEETPYKKEVNTKNVDTHDYLKHDPSLEFVKHRIEKQIFIRCICTLSPLGILLKRDDSKSFRETRLVKEHELDFLGGEVFVIRNRIYAMSLENEGAFMYIVESRSIAQLFKAVFELAWEKAKEVDKEILKKKEVQKILKS